MTRMTPLPPLHSRGATRRRVLLGVGLGALAVTPVATSLSPAAATSAAPAEDHDYECLADLVEAGEVTRADYVAG